MEQDNIEEIRKKAEIFESQYIKLKQEFKDYIEASRKNEKNKRQEMKNDVAKRLLVVADSLNRISGLDNNTSCDTMKHYSENLKKNIEVVYNQLLSASGLTPIDPAAGDRFDEQMHTAIGLEYSTAYPENSVFRVIRKGYRIENNVVRPSEVIVSKRPEVRVTAPGLWDRILRWISPTKLRFAEINQRIDEFERLQKEKIDKLTQDIVLLKNTIAEHERLRQDLASLKNTVMELETKNKKVDELKRVQEEKIEKLTQDIDSLRNTIMELEEKIASNIKEENNDR